MAYRWEIRETVTDFIFLGSTISVDGDCSHEIKRHLLLERKAMTDLLSHFSHVRLCVTPKMAAHQATLSLGFSRQEHWSGLPFPSPMHESERWKWSHSVISDSLRPHGLQPTRLLCPWDFPGKSTGLGCHHLLRSIHYVAYISWVERVFGASIKFGVLPAECFLQGLLWL